MKNKLSFKFSILIGVLTFFVAFGVGQYANNISSKQLEDNSGESLLKLSKNIADILDREMLERYREIKFAASLPTMTNESISKDEKRKLIQKIKDSYNHHKWIGYALPDGTVYVGSDKYLEGKNAKARPWHPAGLKGPYIGDVHDALLLAKLLPNNSGEAIYFSDVAFPVKNKDGKVQGVLCTHLMWQWTRDIIRGIEKENSVDIFLLSKDGLVLVGPNNSERKEIKDISMNVVNKFKNNTNSYSIIDWSKNKKYLTTQTISDGFEEYKGFGWRVIVRQNIDEAFKKSKDNTKNILIASIIAGVLGAILGIIFSNKISSPLNRLSEIVKSLKDSKKVEFDENIKNDEIGNLQVALKELYNSLNNELKLKHIAEDKVEIALKVFDQSLEGIIITDEHNNIILTNRAFTKITGYTQEEIYGKNPSFLSSKEYIKEFYDDMWNDIIKNGKWEGKIINRKKDNSTYEEYLKITTLKDTQGNIINFLATFNSGF